MHHKTEHIASRTRLYRRLHRFLAVPLFAFMFLIGLTGVLLGWKKQAQLTPPTAVGTTTEASKWIGIAQVQELATNFVADSLGLDPAIDRIDIRPTKGVAKVTFAKHYTEVQVDLGSGKVLLAQKRWNDFVEHLHDGTIVDRMLGVAEGPFKITYTTITSFALMMLAVSGFWMWYNPRRMRWLKTAAPK